MEISSNIEVLAHEHRLKEVDWDEKKHGPAVTNKTQHHATYKTLFLCSLCGRHSIHTVRHLLDSGPH